MELTQNKRLGKLDLRILFTSPYYLTSKCVGNIGGKFTRRSQIFKKTDTHKLGQVLLWNNFHPKQIDIFSA